MDKNTIIGFILIGVVLVAFSLLNKPSSEQVAQMKKQQDSIQVAAKEQAQAKTEAETALVQTDHQPTDSASLFFQVSQGEETFVTLENNDVKFTLSTKGGRISSVLLKEYNGQDKKPLTLFDGEDSKLNFTFPGKKENIETAALYFKPIHLTDSTVTMRLVADSTSYIDFNYRLPKEGYVINFDIQTTGMENKLAATADKIDITWTQKAKQLEKGFKFEERYSNLTYKISGDNSDYLSETKPVEKSVPERLDWIAFKNQYFSSVFIATDNFEKSILESSPEKEGSGYLKKYKAQMSTAFDPTGKKASQLMFYFGPNKFSTLKALDKNLDKTSGKNYELDDLVYLGWGPLRWINRWFTIPIFDWLSAWGLNMGIVLLFMTIIVKIVVFPFTYKSYISSARMRVLKPQIDVINKKYPNKEDGMKKQQEVMALYSKYGVSPMGGCLPMLIQMPVFLALFMFVPTAIELRQQSFLWASDLSTYDAFITWKAQIPFIGNHLSLFCLLFSASNILNTMYTMKQQDTGQQTVPGMKAMMYIMPVMFIFILNDYASGLNYYYFISALISIITMIVLRKVVDDNKLLAQLEANKNKPRKKSGLMAKMEAMQKEQERLTKERNKQQGRR